MSTPPARGIKAPGNDCMRPRCGGPGYAQQDFCKNNISVPEVVNGIITILNARDAYTYKHYIRVAGMAELIGFHLGFKGRTLQMQKTAARLHDIGKIGVSDHILRKNGALSKEEFSQMKKHPDIGDEILDKIDPFRELAPWVMDHHERWDGKGYPGGIAGDKIGMASRILAVADALDALTSERPYRGCRPFDRALREIMKNPGTQFCPPVAHSVFDLAPTLENYLSRSNDLKP